MRKVLMIAYQFPPMGGSGVQRTAKFVKYLREFDWEPVVLTRSLKGMELTDESLLKDIPPDVEIIRTKAYDPTSLPGILRLPGKFAGRKLFIPDAEMLWRYFTENTARNLVANGDIGIVYTTSYPYSDHILGLDLKKRFPDVPWVADFRDEWTKNPYLIDNPHNPCRTAIEKKMEKNVLDNADVLITNTPIMERHFIETDIKYSQKFNVIPNGFDSDDFPEVREAPSNPSFTLTYAGLLYGRRKPDTFFEALSGLIKEGKIDSRNIRVNLIGNFKTADLKKRVRDFSLAGIVEIIPYADHDLCLDMLSGSDALLLIEGTGPGAEAFYTGKVFEYMRTGRPILAIIPEHGAAAGLIRETGTGLVSDYNDIENIKQNLYRLYENWRKGIATCTPDNDRIMKYDRRNLTEQLAKLFDNAAGFQKRLRHTQSGGNYEDIE